MAVNLLAIADAIATRLGAVTVPIGEPAIVGATARLPNGIPDTPYILVLPPSGELGMPEGFPSSRIRDTHDFEIYLLLNKASGDLPTDLARVYAWWAVIRDALMGQMKLGVSTVMKAAITDDYEFDSFDYEGQGYHAWRFTVRVWTEVTVTVAI
jgi:hypothetical protein